MGLIVTPVSRAGPTISLAGRNCQMPKKARPVSSLVGRAQCFLALGSKSVSVLKASPKEWVAERRLRSQRGESPTIKWMVKLRRALKRERQRAEKLIG